MSISRKMGILVFCGVPAVIGGGILYALFGHSFTPVIIYEASSAADSRRFSEQNLIDRPTEPNQTRS